jgi:hypothetical protein
MTYKVIFKKILIRPEINHLPLSQGGSAQNKTNLERQWSSGEEGWILNRLIFCLY